MREAADLDILKTKVTCLECWHVTRSTCCLSLDSFFETSLTVIIPRIDLNETSIHECDLHDCREGNSIHRILCPHGKNCNNRWLHVLCAIWSYLRRDEGWLIIFLSSRKYLSSSLCASNRSVLRRLITENILKTTIRFWIMRLYWWHKSRNKN